MTSPPPTVRLLTWNIQHGGGPRRTPWIALALVQARADVVVLTEFRAVRGGPIRGALADHGLRHQAISAAAGGANALLIASRWPLGAPLAPPSPPNPVAGAATLGIPGAAAGRMLEARIPELDLHIVGAHIPPPAPGIERAWVWREVLRAARMQRHGDTAILGDFNTGRAGADGTRFQHTALLGQLATLGYTDAWRQMHPTARQMTWHGPGNACGRIDHCFLSAGLAGRLAAARIEDFPGDPAGEAPAARLSDHAPLVVEIARLAATEPQAATNSGGPEGGPRAGLCSPRSPAS